LTYSNKSIIPIKIIKKPPMHSATCPYFTLPDTLPRITPSIENINEVVAIIGKAGIKSRLINPRVIPMMKALILDANDAPISILIWLRSNALSGDWALRDISTIFNPSITMMNITNGQAIWFNHPLKERDNSHPRVNIAPWNEARVKEIFIVPGKSWHLKKLLI
jgi:hypothetical protein